MERIINIDGIGVPFKASGATPRIYRGVTGRDLFTDLSKLENVKTFTPELLEVYEDLAYTMRKQGNDALGEEKEKDFPSTPDEWLDTIGVLDIYDILPQLIELWRDNEKTTVEAKKNIRRQADN